MAAAPTAVSPSIEGDQVGQGRCCVQLGRAGLIAWEPRSDGECEFAEGRREAQLWRGVGGEFVVAAAKVLHERVAGGDPCGGAEAFDSAHRPEPRLQPTMIGFDPVVAILLGEVRRRRD
jgi:hypothetical protein